ncbi:MAG: 16S rRNA (guanine(966)-N(2))-methyltransferase RsmD [Rickettsiales bacterium]|nr:16S rRNA (guanine(966)-N(2))-methyltransferase RsmD [Rickettsiales bacterium]
MRIVAGKFRGKNLAASDHLKSLRPTTDKNREALFNILSSAKFIKEIGFQIVGSEVLDLCCGSGAVGFEALSRGAGSVVFIDNNQGHLALTKKNSELLKVEKDVKIICADAKNLPQNEKLFNLIFIDPPYAAEYLAIMTNLLEKGWANKTSLIVVEFQSDAKPQDFASENFQLLDLRKYGKTSFAFFTVNF